MNSNNIIQKEVDHTDLMGGEAIEKMRALIEKSSGSCFFCTSNLMDINYSTPISILKSDSNGDLWFVSPKDCFKSMGITQDYELTLFFPDTSLSEYLELKGKIKMFSDENRIKGLLELMDKDQSRDGLDGRRISIYQFIPEKGFYWDVTKNTIGELHFGQL